MRRLFLDFNEGTRREEPRRNRTRHLEALVIVSNPAWPFIVTSVSSSSPRKFFKHPPLGHALPGRNLSPARCLLALLLGTLSFAWHVIPDISFILSFCFARSYVGSFRFGRSKFQTLHTRDTFFFFFNTLSFLRNVRFEQADVLCRWFVSGI